MTEEHRTLDDERIQRLREVILSEQTVPSLLEAMDTASAANVLLLASVSEVLVRVARSSPRSYDTATLSSLVQTRLATAVRDHSGAVQEEAQRLYETWVDWIDQIHQMLESS